MLKPLFLSAALVACALPVALAQQGNIKTYKRNGLDFFEEGRYANAAEALTVYRRYRPDDDDIWYALAVSSYKLNDLDAARTLFEGIERSGVKAPDDIALYLGRLEHHEGNFAEAAAHYKRFLGQIDDDHDLYRSLVDDVRRAGYGDRLGANAGALPAYSENVGPGINTTGDEFHPLLSPNYQDRMYFASAREGSTGGYRNVKGFADPERGTVRADMYAARLEGGRWVGGDPLSYLLNTPDHDVPLDFAMGGQVLLFWKGKTLYSGELLVDTFRRQAEARNLFAPNWAASPMVPEHGDKDPYFFNDTTLIFSSQREGGYGGFDLYSSVRRAGEWLPAVNLGENINSGYDERCGFLAADGRALYFSSNRASSSVGGFDVFRAVFDDREVAWSAPQNLGLAVNSAGDELNFRLSGNGLEGYYDSTNKGKSLGGRDIFVAYLKERAQEQQSLSRPVTYIQVLAAARRDALAAALDEDYDPAGTIDGVDRSRIPVSIRLEPLPYGASDNVITPGNIQKARPVLQFLEQYPGARVVITAHSDDGDPERFRTYFGVKRAERFAAYLQERGVEPERIQVMSVGSYYPIAENAYNDQPSPQGQKFNRRLELHVVPTDAYVLSKDYNDPRVPDFIQTDLYESYRSLQEGVVFRVEVAELAQMYDDDAWLQLPAPTIQGDAAGEAYRYSVGTYASYRSARQMATELKRKGAERATVVAYLDGLRLTPTEVATFADEYPELELFAAQAAE